MENKQSKLKRCPFCGYDVIYIHKETIWELSKDKNTQKLKTIGWSFTCGSYKRTKNWDKTHKIMFYGSSRDEAIKMWNSRGRQNISQFYKDKILIDGEYRWNLPKGETK